MHFLLAANVADTIIAAAQAVGLILVLVAVSLLYDWVQNPQRYRTKRAINESSESVPGTNGLTRNPDTPARPDDVAPNAIQIPNAEDRESVALSISERQFWVLAAEVPTGPFSIAQIHAKISAGVVGWDVPVCEIGASNWQPLISTPGIGPNAKEGPDLAPTSVGIPAKDLSPSQTERTGGQQIRTLPASPAITEDAWDLRNQLMQDPFNNGLRKRYLAARPGFMRLMDDGTVGRVAIIFSFMVGGAIVGASSSSHDYAKLSALGGAVIGIVTAFFTVGNDAKSFAHNQVRSEIGPLPFDATLDLDAARRKFLHINEFSGSKSASTDAKVVEDA